MTQFERRTIRIKDFAAYTGLCRQTASKHYQVYLTLSKKRPWQKLTVADVAAIDDLPAKVVFQLVFK